MLNSPLPMLLIVQQLRKIFAFERKGGRIRKQPQGKAAQSALPGHNSSSTFLRHKGTDKQLFICSGSGFVMLLCFFYLLLKPKESPPTGKQQRPFPTELSPQLSLTSDPTTHGCLPLSPTWQSLKHRLTLYDFSKIIQSCKQARNKPRSLRPLLGSSFSFKKNNPFLHNPLLKSLFSTKLGLATQLAILSGHSCYL